MKIQLLNAPDTYYQWLGADISEQLCRKGQLPDLVHVFAKDYKELTSILGKLAMTYKKNSSLVIWVSWYKKASKIPTDITEDRIRDYALKNGLVDVKVCAVSENWSGLKLVVPLAKRTKI